MPHSEEIQSNPEDSDETVPTSDNNSGESGEDSIRATGKTPVKNEAQAEEEKTGASHNDGLDVRFSRLKAMQSRYVTEETLRATEEKSSSPQTKQQNDKTKTHIDRGDDIHESDDEHEDDEFEDDKYEDDEHEDDEYEDDEFEDDEYEDDEYEDDEFEDDAYDDEHEDNDDDFDDEHKEQDTEAKEAATLAEANDSEASSKQQPPSKIEKNTDHRIAQLRKLKRQFVSDKDLEVSPNVKKATVDYGDANVVLVVCPNCQSEEPRTGKICSKCSAKLPNLTAISEEKYNPGSLNKAVLKYYQAVESLKSGDWTSEDFSDFLHERIELSETQIDVLLNYMEETGSAEWLPDATKLIKDSTLLLEDSIREMIHRLEDLQHEQQVLDLDFEEAKLQHEEILTKHANDEEFTPPPSPEGPAPLDERIKDTSFKEQLDNITSANKMMLEALRLIDKFDKKSREDLEVSL